jgi:5-methylcytosine-specific restriction endonuclease McrA
MSKVFVLDTNKQPLNPVHPGRARLLLKEGKAAVLRRYPFTIILNKAVPQPHLEPLRIKLDPGSKTTGLAIVNDASGEVVWAAELTRRGDTIREHLAKRKATRRSRRQRKTRYRPPRFANRRKPKGWLAPSLESRLANIETWVRRLMHLCPITAISQELVKFDMQAIDHPEISGVQYQQGTLYGYELREYLLEKWQHTCAYCGAQDLPLQLEHIHPRANGGSNRVSNLCVACEACNRKKGTQDIRDFLAHQPALLEKILAHSSAPLKDAAVMNATRWALYDRLKAIELPVECGSGGLTKYHRMLRALPKAHWLDAACVGTSTPLHLKVEPVIPLLIKATGRQARQMCRMDTYGFPRTSAKQQRLIHGFQTGDIVKAVLTTGKKRGTYVGRVAVRSRGSFNITTADGTIQGISHHHCTPSMPVMAIVTRKEWRRLLPPSDRLVGLHAVF